MPVFSSYYTVIQVTPEFTQKYIVCRHFKMYSKRHVCFVLFDNSDRPETLFQTIPDVSEEGVLVPFLCAISIYKV